MSISPNEAGKSRPGATRAPGPARRRPGRLIKLSLIGAGVVLLGLVLGAWPRHRAVDVPFPVQATPERVARGRVLASMLCTRCHLDAGTGRLSGKPMPASPLGDLIAPNITQDRTHGIGAWSDGQLAYLLRTGVTPGGDLVAEPMVRLPHLSDEDLAALIAFLRSDDALVRAVPRPQPRSRPSLLGWLLQHMVSRPLPYPARPVPGPLPEDDIALGRYTVIAVAQCWRCHSADFASLDDLEPERSAGYLAGGTELFDAAGTPLRSPNLTPDPATGLGRWSEADLARALRQGRGPDGRQLVEPMPLYPELTDRDVRAIFAYLRTIPPVPHEVLRRSLPAPGAPSSMTPDEAGRVTYEMYGCRGCHGDQGVGVADLRGVNERFPTDQALEAWIRRPGTIRPGTKMPGFDGIIPDDRYPALMRYVRGLGRQR